MSDNWSDDEWAESDNEDIPQFSAAPYEILNEDAIEQHEAMCIQNLYDEFSIDVTQSRVLLIQHNWDVAKVIDKIRSGSLDLPVFQKQASLIKSSKYPCVLCYQILPGREMKSLECGHAFCISCYRLFLTEAVMSGKECVLTKCPMENCLYAIPEVMFQDLLTEKLYEKFRMFLVRSYIERNKQAKWCPAPGCNAAAIVRDEDYKEIQCLCGFSWCFVCGKEVHRPLTCEMLKKWDVKISSDDNETWLIANTKKCPKCKNAIQKNLGCMHMTCKCGHQFCWLCLDDWAAHSSSTGGNYRCNKFTLEKQKGKYQKEEDQRVAAAYSIKRFEHYYNRYINHKASLKLAKEKSHKAKIDVSNLYAIINESHIFDFISESTELLYKAKRYLAYSYSLGYFMTSPAKIQFYEFIQGALEDNEIKLDELTNKDIMQFVNYDNVFPRLIPEFTNYRMEVLNLNSVVKNYFEECLRQMENGFPEITDSGEDMASGELIKKSINFSYLDKWICPSCTLGNDMNTNECSACGNKRAV